MAIDASYLCQKTSRSTRALHGAFKQLERREASNSGDDITVLTALSRMGVDPWREAARLAVMPRVVHESGGVMANLTLSQGVRGISSVLSRTGSRCPQQGVPDDEKGKKNWAEDWGIVPVIHDSSSTKGAGAHASLSHCRPDTRAMVTTSKPRIRRMRAREDSASAISLVERIA